MTNTKPDAPLEVGQIVGHEGRRAEVAYIPASFKHYKLLIRYLDGDVDPVTDLPRVAFVWATDLHSPPPLPDRITEHVPALAAHLGNPRAIFDEEG